jgi:hypothetical protein
VADLQLDEDGRAIKDEDPGEQDGVIIVELAIAPIPGSDTPPMQLSKAELAALKVNSMRDDDQPTLMPVKPVERSSRKAKETPAKKSEPARSGKPSKAAPAKQAPPASKGGKSDPAPKPKMRLVNGKLVPVADSGPKLF